MASLFRDFSFDTPSRLPEPLCTESASPTSMSPSLFPARPPTPPPCDMNELVLALGKQDLRVVVDPKFRAQYEPLTPPSDEDTFANHLPEPTQLSTARMNAATLRMQRQANVRMQCSVSHIKDISSLVEKMIEVEDQCHLCEPKSKRSSVSSLGEDEGVGMDYTPTAKEQMRSMLPHYRAGDRIDGSARVSKRPRMRRSTCSLSKLAKRHSR
ncbi:hypothetical protein BU23DRAFT_553547 [Bimuria novae-zelandiae CBS 107.79]|uniref:Uncharacterized protein n=1 Tax=Bimuria novae-zelandiae CBS 107.79 TaxID=1447943 RepID=A0A6A5V9R8_9PLEO|nr:hypothetical protein BU23DRAFT_553547 [Bimuria novae-zelandiae CBS 107.79]